MKYTGRRGAGQKDEKKECELSNEQISSIRKVIDDKRLDGAPVVDNSLSDESYQVTTAITITLTNGNKTVKTKVKGKPSGWQASHFTTMPFTCSV